MNLIVDFDGIPTGEDSCVWRDQSYDTSVSNTHFWWFSCHEWEGAHEFWSFLYHQYFSHVTYARFVKLLSKNKKYRHEVFLFYPIATTRKRKGSARCEVTRDPWNAMSTANHQAIMNSQKRHSDTITNHWATIKSLSNHLEKPRNNQLLYGLLGFSVGSHRNDPQSTNRWNTEELAWLSREGWRYAICAADGMDTKRICRAEHKFIKLKTWPGDPN